MNKNIEDKLLEKNTNPTSMRILVYDFLEHQKTAMSLSQIENHFDQADRTTLYRTMKTFEEKGIAHSIQENNLTKYILCNDGCNEETHRDWHLHFYCKICKQTTCEEEFMIPQNKNLGFRIDEIKLFGKGICKNCLTDSLQ